MSLPIDIPPTIPEPLPPASPVGAGSPTPLPAQGETERLELLQAGLGYPVPLCYGRHIVGGSVILQHEAADGKVHLFIALGAGPWGGVEKAWVNGVEVQSDSSKFHFHPGKDGEAGTETDPGTPNQKICSFWPSGISPAVTFSRTAYIALKLDRDPEAPGPGFDVRGVYQTRKVRSFDQNGNQTSFAYSANPAWCILDLLITRWLKPYALAGAELTAAEKARIDFAAWKTAADDCDYDIGGGVKRFECHVAFVSEIDTLRALEQMLLLCRGYLIEKNGKLGLYVDKDRSPVFTAGADEIAPNSLTFLEKPQRQLANQFIFHFRALDSGSGDASKDFQPQIKELADEAHQDAIGRVIKAEIDLGNQTAERVERLGVWLKGRTMLTRQLRARLLPGTAAIDLLPGDLITAPDDLDYQSTRTWEVLEITDNPDGSRDIFAQEFDNSIFTDTAGAQQAPTDTTPGEGPQPVGAPTTAPPAPTWVSFTAEKGIFRPVLDHPTLEVQAFETLLIYQVQLASDSNFTQNVTTHTLGSKLEADIIKPRVTRYARARCRFPQSPWGPWANWGSPTAVSSGHPADDMGQGGTFDPADPRIRGDAKPGTRAADVTALFAHHEDDGRFDSLANLVNRAAEHIVEDALRKFVHGDALDANRKVDLSKPGVINKLAEHILRQAGGANLKNIVQKLTDAGLVQDPDQFASFFGSTFGLMHRRPAQVGFINTDFEQGGSSPLDADSGWYKAGGNDEDFSYETASPLAGNRSLKIEGDAIQHKCLRNRFGLVVRPGEKFYIQATAKVSATNVPALMGFEWHDANGGYIGTGRISFDQNTSPVTKNMTVTVPDNAARGYLNCWVGGWGTAGTAWFDEIIVNKVAADDQPLCVGRTEGGSTTLSKITNDGLLQDADQIASDGATYGRPRLDAMTDGRPDLAKNVQNKLAEHILRQAAGANLKNIVQKLTDTGLLQDADQIASDGSTYGRTKLTALTDGEVDLSKGGVINKVAANILREAGGTNLQAIVQKLTDAGLLTDADQVAADGSTFRRFGHGSHFHLRGIFKPDQFNGAENPGEIDFDPIEAGGDYLILHPDGSAITVSNANRSYMSQGCIDDYTGRVYVVFSKQLCNTQRGLSAYQDSHILVVRYVLGTGWQYDTNTGWTDFTPVASDICIFEVDRGGGDWANDPTRYIGKELLSHARASIALTDSGNIAAATKVGGDSGLDSARLPEVIIEVNGEGKLDPTKFNEANIGKKTGEEVFTSGSCSSIPGGAPNWTGWGKAGQTVIDVGTGISSITFRVKAVSAEPAPENRVWLRTEADNIGLWIGTGTPPGTPTESVEVTLDGGYIDITYNNPPVGAGKTLALYMYIIDSAGSYLTITGYCAQDIMVPIGIGKVS